MHAFLIVGGTSDTRQKTVQDHVTRWKVAAADVISVIPEGAHITIDDVRAFKKRLLLTPMQSPHTVGVIPNAHLLTTEAQQALLKLLEEPPPHAYIVCETDTVDLLLPTIISRCQVVRLVEEKAANKETGQLLQTLLTASVGDIMDEVDKHTTEREEAKLWTRNLIDEARNLLLTAANTGDTKQSEALVILIRKLQLASSQLNVNCNPKLVLDRVFLPH